jgi:hypothetical protein
MASTHTIWQQQHCFLVGVKHSLSFNTLFKICFHHVPCFRTVVNSITADQIKTLIASEVRDLMLNTEKIQVRDASSYPPVKKLPAAQALRILVTGGSGFVGTTFTYLCTSLWTRLF